MKTSAQLVEERRARTLAHRLIDTPQRVALAQSIVRVLNGGGAFPSLRLDTIAKLLFPQIEQLSTREAANIRLLVAKISFRLMECGILEQSGGGSYRLADTPEPPEWWADGPELYYCG